jgi:hypothetical protein
MVWEYISSLRANIELKNSNNAKDDPLGNRLSRTIKTRIARKRKPCLAKKDGNFPLVGFSLASQP